MLKYLVVFILSLITNYGIAKPDARPEVRIPEKVEVSQKPILHLGDIAEVKDASLELVQLLDKVVLRQEARELLLSQKLVSREIIIKLREAMKTEGLRNLNPLFNIPTTVEVHFSKEVLSKEELTRRFANIIQAKCESCEVQIQIQNTPSLQVHDWKIDTSQFAGKGAFLVPINGQNGARLGFVSGTSKIFKLTPITTRLVAQGERLQSEDLKMSLVDITFSKDNSPELKDLIGQPVVRNLSVGTAVYSQDIRKEPATKRGQLVKALLGKEGIEISTSLIAEQNGFVGDVIRLKSPENQKVFSGVIVEKGLVHLE